MPAEWTPPIPDLLPLIPLSTRVLLDVGCGDGALGARFRALSPTTRLLGIEPDPVAASAAAEHLDEVAAVDVEEVALPFDVEGGIDCIVYHGILALLRDPWAVIRRHAEALSPDGVMLISVPNLGHWSFADRLLRGTWDHERDGLLDHAHLRWFSLEGMRRGLVEAGLALCDVQPQGMDQERAQQFGSALAPGLAALGIDVDFYVKRAAPLRYLWRVRKTMQQRMTVAGNMLPPIGGVSHVRVVHPLQALATDPLVTALLTDRLEPIAFTDDTRAAPPGDGRRVGPGDPAPADRCRVAGGDRIRRPSRLLFRHAARRRVVVSRRACAANQHPGAGRGPAALQPGGRDLPQCDGVVAAGAQLRQSARPDLLLRRAEPGGRLAGPDAGDQCGSGDGGGAAEISCRA
jgi:SAM-dependent methyltransferase